MAYQVIFNHPALKRHFEDALRPLSDSQKTAIMNAVLNLANEPRPYGVIKIKPLINIYNSLAQYRIRVGRYRIFYDIDDHRKTVSIIALRKRDEKTYL